MKLINLTIIIILSLSYEYNFINYGNLSRYDKIETTNSSELAVCMNMDEFKDEDNIYLKAIVYNGHFDDDRVYYGYYSSISNIVDLYYYQFFNSEERGRLFSGNDYYDYTYYFEIKKQTNYKYLFVSIPRFKGSHIEMEISKQKTGISIGAIIGIIIGVVAFIATIIIVVIYCIKKSKKNDSPPSPVVVYSPSLVSSSDKPDYTAQTDN